MGNLKARWGPSLNPEAKRKAFREREFWPMLEVADELYSHAEASICQRDRVHRQAFLG
jgi:hypothetical protein